MYKLKYKIYLHSEIFLIPSKCSLITILLYLFKIISIMFEIYTKLPKKLLKAFETDDKFKPFYLVEKLNKININ